MKREVYSEEHEDYRAMIRAFVEAEVSPVYDEWFEKGLVPREFYYKLGELGIFGAEIPEEYGGEGLTSYKFQAILTEELARAAVSFGGSSVHVGLCLPYIRDIAMASAEGRNMAFIDVQNPAISDHPDVAPASLGLQVTLLNQLLCGVDVDPAQLDALRAANRS